MVDEQLEQRVTRIEQQVAEIQELVSRADTHVEREVSHAVERGIRWIELKMDNGFASVEASLSRIFRQLERGEKTWSTKS